MTARTWFPHPPAYLIGLLAASVACSGSDSGTSPPPPPAVTVAKAPVSGDGQTGTVGQALANAIRVLVTRDGAPEVGATVTWTTTGTGASVSPATVVTDAAGLAATSWTLPQAAGLRGASAAVSGAGGSPVNFSATALPGPATQLTLRSGGGQSGQVSQALPLPLKVRAADQYGNGVAGIIVDWQALTGGGLVAPVSSTTDTSGASTTWTLGPAVGAQTAQGAASGLTGSPVGFTATGTAPPPVTVDVNVGNNVFSPGTVTISAGQAVRWTWVATGAISHSVESTGSPSFASSAILTGSGSTYSVTFPTPGVYTYDCAVHGALMSGTVTVN